MRGKRIESLFKGVIASLLILVSSGCFSNSYEYLINAPSPSVRLTLLDGSRVALESFQGKRVVLAFWATHCAKSKRMLREVVEIARKRAERSDIVFFAPSIDPNNKLSAVQERIASLHAPTIQFAFSGNDVEDEAFLLFQGTAIPYIVVIERDGTIMYAGDDYSLIPLYLDKHEKRIVL